MAMVVNPPSARTISTVSGLRRLTQSHRMFCFPVRSRRARWPIANLGSVEMPQMPGPSSKKTLRNPVLRRELESLSRKVNLSWVTKAVEGFDALHSRTRRNINRSLGLDAVAISLARPAPGIKN